jgi:acetamidase/formamidase
MPLSSVYRHFGGSVFAPSGGAVHALYSASKKVAPARLSQMPVAVHRFLLAGRPEKREYCCLLREFIWGISVYTTWRGIMCQGDDRSCPQFDLHREQLLADLDHERRSFLKSAFVATGGAAALTAGGAAMVAPAAAQTAAARQGKPSHYFLPATADTVHWGYFSKLLKPQIEIDSGDYVTIEALTHHANDDAERMIKGDPGAESVYLWTKDKKGVDRRGAGPMDGKLLGRGAGEGLGVHICTGPVYVRDAEPGDILEVRIIDVKPRPSANPQYAGKAFGSNAAAWWGFHYKELLTEPKPREVITIYEIDATGQRNWASAVYNFQWTPQTDPFGVVHKTIDYPGVPVDHKTIKENHGILKNVRIPIRPHFGVLGLAPKEADIVDSIPPGYFGGNIDNWRIGKGATMYYPVAVPGGLLSVGDSHASQGDSELCGTAIECSLTGTFQLIVHKKATLGGTSLATLDYPLLETQDEWVLHGFSYANYLAELGEKAQSQIYEKSSVDLALKDAFRKMRAFLMSTKGLTEDEAISLISIAVDFGVTQVVDGNWGVHAVIKKSLFAGAVA